MSCNLPGTVSSKILGPNLVLIYTCSKAGMCPSGATCLSVDCCFSEIALANSTIFQPYHGENKFIFNEMMMRSALYYVDQHACLDFYSAISLKQQSTDRHVAPLGHIPAFEQVYTKRTSSSFH
jgi:hypothetical protein